MSNQQGIAVRIEQIMRSALNCKRYDIGGLVNSDYIKNYPFMAMMCTLTLLCRKEDSIGIDIVSEFFENYYEYAEYSVGEWQNLESCEEPIEEVIEKFSETCVKLK